MPSNAAANSKPKRPRRKPQFQRPNLTLKQVLQIYYADPAVSSNELSRLYDIGINTVRLVRAGKMYTKLLAEAKNMRLCVSCQHASNGRCLMGFPEAETEGPVFAQECTIYKGNQTND